jgi:hypothetical protein
MIKKILKKIGSALAAPFRMMFCDHEWEQIDGEHVCRKCPARSSIHR